MSDSLYRPSRFGGFFLFSVLFLAGSLVYLWITLPPVSDLKKKNPGETAMMKYRARQAAKKGGRESKMQMWVRLELISPYLIKTVILAEDDRFYQHGGVDWEALRQAFRTNMERNTVAFGGSTITQQLAKNLFLSPRKNILRKIREILLAYKLERKLSKSRILEIYLNVVEWAPGIYGAEAASFHYFDKSSRDLTLTESVRLVSVLPSPRRFKIFEDSKKWMNGKREDWLERLLKREWISPAEYREASRELHLSAFSQVEVSSYTCILATVPVSGICGE
ncbi:MAG TPA: monofunctional biosynthetic peptidoglycan transglycosylase [bacterium]|nr:monofunctional biosynthetic peptidoglycan transglycosylase [bacterium]